MSINTLEARHAALSLVLLLSAAAPLAAQLPGMPAPTPVSLTVGPATVTVIVGQQGTVFVSARTSTGAAFVPTSDAVFTVDVADRSIVSAPATVTMLHGQSSASLALTGLAIGRVAVTVRYAALAASTSVTVMGVGGTTTAAPPPPDTATSVVAPTKGKTKRATSQ
jgi:hypothetical protein